MVTMMLKDGQAALNKRILVTAFELTEIILAPHLLHLWPKCAHVLLLMNERSVRDEKGHY